ncbi:HNH endonuclease [Paeniglutamicibacter sp. NPDC012692]|uniref:HNH endonuclease n=1 Tax=Paeniglutamicibacter sp. NPDC012692 TaxID=3364388 RepID=UPI00367B2547
MVRKSGRGSKAMTALVLATYGDVCHLKLPGCTRRATTKDHIVPYSLGGEDVLENYRPACRPCNSARGNRIYGGAGFGANVKVVIGPPAAGKTTHIEQHSTLNDIMIDLDAIARALMPNQQAHSHVYPVHVRHVAIGARKAAIDRATRLKERCTVWIIHAVPTPDEIARYQAMRWEVIEIDPGREEVLRRCYADRPDYVMPTVDRWYAYKAGRTITDTSDYDDATTALKPSNTTAQPSRDW